MISTKQKYRTHCKVEPLIPVFSKDWWLDAVCGNDNWNVVVVEKGGQIIASMPYYMVKSRGVWIITMPKLTQTMGTWLKYPPNQKHANRLSFEKKIMNTLIDSLPKFDSFSQNFHYSTTNWLPFYWHGFKQTTRYTYILENLKDLEEVKSRFKGNMRNKIRKAQKIVRIVTDKSVDEFYNVNKLTFDRQNISIPYSLEFLKRQDNALKEHNARKIFFAVDNDEQVHSALYLIWDSMSSYVHMVGEDPILRQSGAGIFLILEALKFTAYELGLNCFDFEGSMIKSIEEVRRSCGGVQKPYFQITKVNSRLLKLKSLIKQVIRI